MKTQAFNPYLPLHEYIPDGEPYVFGDRVYVYGSHDLYNGCVFCMGDYMGWSASLSDLGAWRCEGVIYDKTEDPLNRDGRMCLYAPDVTVGPDGRYYLYYVLDKVCVVSVAVCDTPAGRYRFYGYVHYKDGTRLGEKPGDESQFDPGVLTEGDVTYLYTGFCGFGDKTRHGAMCTVLDKDMLTIIQAPVFVAPGKEYEQGTGFEGHAFFEAPSIRKRGDTYYFVYSSSVMHELCWAKSDRPTGGFTYGGVIVSNADIGIASYKDASMPVALAGNNHGSIVDIGGQWYVFYHRQTNNTSFSRQGCAEPICFDKKGDIAQVSMTSRGLNGQPLEDKGEYSAAIACRLFVEGEKTLYSGGDKRLPRIMQDGRDGDEGLNCIGDIRDGTVVGFVDFSFDTARGLEIETRGYMRGAFEVSQALGGKTLASIPVENTNVWTARRADVRFEKGAHPLYLTFRGHGGNAQLRSIRFI